jgi:hypothetical protein
MVSSHRRSKIFFNTLQFGKKTHLRFQNFQSNHLNNKLKRSFFRKKNVFAKVIVSYVDRNKKKRHWF